MGATTGADNRANSGYGYDEQSRVDNLNAMSAAAAELSRGAEMSALKDVNNNKISDIKNSAAATKAANSNMIDDLRAENSRMSTEVSDAKRDMDRYALAKDTVAGIDKRVEGAQKALDMSVEKGTSGVMSPVFTSEQKSAMKDFVSEGSNSRAIMDKAESAFNKKQEAAVALDNAVEAVNRTSEGTPERAVANRRLATATAQYNEASVANDRAQAAYDNKVNEFASKNGFKSSEVNMVKSGIAATKVIDDATNNHRYKAAAETIAQQDAKYGGSDGARKAYDAGREKITANNGKISELQRANRDIDVKSNKDISELQRANREIDARQTNAKAAFSNAQGKEKDFAQAEARATGRKSPTFSNKQEYDKHRQKQEIISKYADTQNFNKPEIKEHLSYEQLAKLEREKAHEIRVENRVKAVGNVAGAVVGVTAALGAAAVVKTMTLTEGAEASNKAAGNFGKKVGSLAHSATTSGAVAAVGSIAGVNKPTGLSDATRKQASRDLKRQRGRENTGIASAKRKASGILGGIERRRKTDDGMDIKTGGQGNESKKSDRSKMN